MTSKCLLNLDMSAALRLLSVCCSHPLLHHTDSRLLRLRNTQRSSFVPSRRARLTHLSNLAHPSRPSISLTIQSITSYDTANTSPEIPFFRRRSSPEDSRLLSPGISAYARHDTLFLHLHRQIAERIARAEERAADLQRSTRAQQHVEAPLHQSTSTRTSKRTDRRESQEMGTSAH